MKTEEASRALFLLLVVFGITYCVRIYGLGERYVAALNTLSDILLVLVISAVAWLLYRWLIGLLLAWVEDVADGKGASAYPLMVLLGSIVVVMADTYYILVSLGVSSSVATLSASITGFAVSFGAQSTLSQFFNGMMLLATHPFEVGDVVTLNNDGARLIVRRIGVMTTVFEDWNTGTKITVPNDRVSKSSIQNVTSSSGAYAFVMSLNVSYDLDFQKVRGVILEVLEGNPHVIKDPEHRPAVTLDQFLDNTASVKITTFIDDYMNHAAITSEIRESIVSAFRDNGLPITHSGGSRSSGSSRYRAPRVRICVERHLQRGRRLRGASSRSDGRPPAQPRRHPPLLRSMRSSPSRISSFTLVSTLYPIPVPSASKCLRPPRSCTIITIQYPKYTVFERL